MEQEGARQEQHGETLIDLSDAALERVWGGVAMPALMAGGAEADVAAKRAPAWLVANVFAEIWPDAVEIQIGENAVTELGDALRERALDARAGLANVAWQSAEGFVMGV